MPSEGQLGQSLPGSMKVQPQQSFLAELLCSMESAMYMGLYFKRLSKVTRHNF